MATNLHLRGIAPPLMAQLKTQAASQEVSVNSLILQLLQESLGLKAPPRSRTYNDLDPLAGTWDLAQSEEFKQACTDFEEIDKGLWK